YKRAQPDASDYVTLAPGASLTRSVDLAKFYDLSATGTYAVEISIDDTKLRGQTGLIVSTPVAAQIEGRAAIAKGKPNRDTCSVDQHAQIDAALPIAGQYAAAARDYLAAAPSATLRYTTWFGAFAPAGWD